MRVLFLTGLENPLYNKHRNMVDGVRTAEFFASNSVPSRLLRRLAIRMPQASLAFSLGDWLEQADDFNLIIISGTIYSHAIANTLIRRGLKKKLVHWFWNPVTPNDRIDLILKQGVPAYTFDPSDASRYGLRLETTYYFSTLCRDAVLGRTPELDVFFVGGDKGRLGSLLDVKSILDAGGLATCFHIVDTRHRPVPGNYQFQSPIGYAEVLDYIARSRCLLDYVQQGQHGLTQRPMEALFHRRKLITNDLSVLDQDFYNPDNIFLLGRDDIAVLPAFVKAPSREVDPAIIARYDFSNWLKRIASSVLHGVSH